MKTKYIVRLFGLALVLLTLSLFPASAQSTWTGATSSAFNVTTNWTPTGVPGSGVNASLPAGATTTTINVTDTESVASLVLGTAPYILNINTGGVLTIASGITGTTANLTINNLNPTNGSPNSLVINGGSGGAATLKNQNFAHAVFTNNFDAGTMTINNTAPAGNNSDFTAVYFGVSGVPTDHSTTDGAKITNTGDGAFLYFYGGSTAGTATIINTDTSGNNNAGIGFHDSSTAAGASITNETGGFTHFHDNSTSDNAQIINENNGTTSYDGDATGGNGTTINNESGGLINISGSSLGGVNIGLVYGAGAITLGANTLTTGTQGATGKISGTITGTGGFTVAGTGTVDLTGDNYPSYSGITTVEGGTLQVGSTNALGAGNVAVTGGTFETDGSIHTIQVRGQYTQTAGTLQLTLTVDAPTNPGNDVLTAANGASLSGGNLHLVFSGFTPVINDKFTVIESLGTITGGYAPGNITSNDPGLGLVGSVITTGDDIYQVTVESVGPTPEELAQLSPKEFSQFAASTAFNNASYMTDDLDEYLAGRRGANGNFVASSDGIDSSRLTINDPSYDPALSEVHSRLLAWNPAPLSSGAISDVASPVLGGIDMKEAKQSNSESMPFHPFNMFIRGNVVLAQGFSQDDLPHFDSTTSSVELGADYQFSPHFLAGVILGYGHTDATLDTNGSSATADSYSPGIYASYADKGWYANGLATYVHNAYTDEQVAPLLNTTLNSAPEGDQATAYASGGYDFHSNNWTFGPTLGLQYTHLALDSYTENGAGPIGLNVSSQDADSLRSRLGGRVNYAIHTCGLTLTPHLAASWQHEFMDQSRGITSQFNGIGTGSLDVATTRPGRDSALVDLGFNAEINQTVTVFTDYITQAGQSQYFGQSVQAGVKIGF